MGGHDRYNRRVAAEALKQSENDRDMALEMLLNPASLATLQVFTGLAISHVRGAWQVHADSTCKMDGDEFPVHISQGTENCAINFESAAQS